MSDFGPQTRLRPLSFLVTIVPGSTAIQAATVHYEVVLPSDRAIPMDRPIALTAIQPVVNAAAAVIVGQLLASEGLTMLWPTPLGASMSSPGRVAVAVVRDGTGRFELI
jgi:hypothetical protein